MVRRLYTFDRGRVHLKTPYKETISALRDWILSLSTAPPNWRCVTIWPSMIPASFIDRLQSSCPVALGILDRWCLIVKQIPERWFFTPWLEVIHSMASKCPSALSTLEYHVFTEAEDL